jgi:hypothetical protein
VNDMKDLDLPFIAGKLPVGSLPLSRYLPPVPPDIARTWLSSHSPAGSWILDPFGAQPHLAVEMARAGYKVLVAANNPIASFMLETLASAPRSDDLRAALADLASARKGDERLEPHIRSLYVTDCIVCKKAIEAKAFIWQKDAQEPEACVVVCPNCGADGEQPVSSANLDRLATLTRSSLHRARALERITSLDDPIRPHVEQALNCYLPRPLYVLITLANRLESLALSPQRHRLATALLLSACDEANTLWPYPTTRSRPRQLVVPSNFKENNLWLALEAAIDQWQSGGSVVPLTVWPDLPPDGGGICLFKGRLRDLVANIQAAPIAAVLTAFPRPNQAFWTLSAVWAGWLWGREAVNPLKSALSRQRYDWNWHATALASTLSTLRPHLKLGTPLLGLITEVEPAFLLAVLVAADNAGFELQGTALRTEQALAEIQWQPRDLPFLSPENVLPEDFIKDSIRAHLEVRAEPAPYLPLLVTAGAAYFNNGFNQTRFQPAAPENPPLVMTALGQIQAAVQKALSDKALLNRFGGTLQSPEHSLWWLDNLSPTQVPLSDRIEMEVVRFLQRAPGSTLVDLDKELCQKFSGVMTPALDFLQVCFESYAEQRPAESGAWFLRPAEAPANRRSDLSSLLGLLQELGSQLGYQVVGANPVTWLDENKNLAYAFYLLASGIISQFIISNPYPAGKSILVLPGSRANLVSHKLHHNPWLNQAITQGWRFLKFRHLRQLAGSLLPDRAIWDEELNGDPLDYKASQIEMDIIEGSPLE